MESLIQKAFNYIRNDTQISSSTLKSVNKYADKLTAKPIDAKKYLKKILDVVSENKKATSLINSVIEQATDDYPKNSPVDAFILILGTLKEESRKATTEYLKIHSLFFSGLVTEEFYAKQTSAVFEKYKIFQIDEKQQIKTVIEGIKESPLKFLLQLPGASTSEFSFIYNPTFPVPPAIQFYVMISLLVEDVDVMDNLLNVIWLYSFNLIPFESTQKILQSINEDVAQLFSEWSNEKPSALHVSSLQASIRNFYPQKINVAFPENVLNFLTNPAQENHVKNAVQLASSSRFIDKQKSPFWTSYYLSNSNAISLYVIYKNISRFSRTFDPSDFPDHSKSISKLVGYAVPEQRMKDTSFINAVLKISHDKAAELNNLSNNILDKELIQTDPCSYTYRDLYKKKIHRSNVKRSLVLSETVLPMIKENAIDNELAILTPILKKMEIYDTIAKLIYDIILIDKEILVSEYTAISIYYLTKLVDITSKLSEEEKKLDFSELLFQKQPPYTDLTGEATCLDMLIIRLARALDMMYPDENSGTFAISLQEDISCHGDFIFKFNKSNGAITLTSVINPFIFKEHGN